MNRYIIGSLWDRSNRNGLNINFEFLFDGVSRMNQLSDKADNTLKEAERINRINNDTNKRLDNIIADSGTSSTEVVDARGEHTVLSGRLNGIDSQLAQTLSKNVTPIFLVDYGVIHTNTPTENTALIKQAIADAIPESRPIVFPWVSENEWIDIDERLIVNGAIKIMGYGVESRIRQTNYPEHIFELQHPGASVEDMFLSGVDFNATSTRGQAYRGTQRTSYFAGVIAHSDRNKIRRVKVDNMVTAVLVSAWDVDIDRQRTQLKDCVVDDIEVSNVTFGLVVQGAQNLYYNNIRGTYKLMPGVTTPPHLIYFDDANGENINSNGGEFHTYDGLNGQAYQFKGMRGGTVSKINANNTRGILNIMNTNDFIIDEVVSLNDTYTSQAYGSLYLQGENDSVKINKITIKMSGDGKPVMIDDEVSNSNLSNLDIQSKHIKEHPQDSYDVDIRGTNNIVDNVRVENIGTHQITASVGIWRGENNTVSNPKTSGNEIGIKIRRTGGNHTLKYSESDIKENVKVMLPGPTNLITNEKNAVGINSQNRLLAFDRANYVSSTSFLRVTTSGHPWVINAGQYRISNGTIYSDAGVPGLAYIDIGTPNVDFSAGVKYADREALVVRATDRSNLIGVRLTTSVAEIFKYDDGPFTQLASTPFPTQVGRRYRFKVLAFGNKIDFYVDDIFMATYTLSSDEMTKFGAITTHGIFTRANPEGKLDNLEWRSIE